jgi:hypothetical protein
VTLRQDTCYRVFMTENAECELSLDVPMNIVKSWLRHFRNRKHTFVQAQ